MDFDGDMWDGWGLATGGTPDTNQARAAVQFYQDVQGAIGSLGDPRYANITLTGHSLGGGLAALVWSAGRADRPARGIN